MIPGVLERRHNPVAATTQAPGQRIGELLGSSLLKTVALRFIGEQLVVHPNRLTVFAPIAAKGPARQGLTGIPFSLAVMQERSGGEPAFQALEQIIREAALSRAEGESIPLRPVHIIDTDKG